MNDITIYSGTVPEEVFNDWENDGGNYAIHLINNDTVEALTKEQTLDCLEEGKKAPDFPMEDDEFESYEEFVFYAMKYLGLFSNPAHLFADSSSTYKYNKETQLLVIAYDPW